MHQVQGLTGLFSVVLTAFFTINTAQADLSKNYGDVQRYLYDLAAKHPQNAEIFTLGVSDNGDIIEGLKIGSGPVANLIVGTHHGNEYGSTELAKAVAASLANDPILGQTVYVVPVLNTAGFSARRRTERSSTTGRYHDPNRDYPGPCGTAGPFHLKSTAALAQFLEDKHIVASATLHTFFPAVVYPWGMATQDLSTPYDDIFVALTQAATVESGYRIGNSTEVIYPANGAFEDYAFWAHGVWSLLFEVGYSHWPSEKAVEEIIRVNVPGIRRMLEQAPTERAENHAFTGRCDHRLSILDLHNE